MILGGLWLNFPSFCCPGDWLEKLLTFQGYPGATPNPATRAVLGTAIPGSLNPIPEFQRPSLGVLRLRRECIGFMTHWKLGCRGCFAAWWPLTRRGRLITLLLGGRSFFCCFFEFGCPEIPFWLACWLHFGSLGLLKKTVGGV